MSDTLLSMADANYRFAKKNMDSFSGDELELNYIGYHLQQAVELTIKHVLEINGIRYSKSHNIDDLLTELDSNDLTVTLKASDWVRDHSERITLWEARTRYIKNFRLEKVKLEEALIEINAFITANADYTSREMDSF